MPHIPGHADPAAQQPGGPQAKPQGGPPDEFELLRRRLKLRGASRGQEQQQDLDRRFAAAGNLPSGAAFKIRQQAAESAERQTSEELQDVSGLEAQTRRQERESEANRDLQRFGITTQAETSRALADVDRQTKIDLGQMDFDARMKTLEVSDTTARYLGEMELDQQRVIADLDRELRRDGLDIQEMAARSGIKADKIEGQLNTFATFVNALDPLGAAGFSDKEIVSMMGDMGIKIPEKQIQNMLKGRSDSEAAKKAAEKAAVAAANVPAPFDISGRTDPGG